ncbi:MAG: transposase, partial [Candidatus Acidiferrales bacterium]
CNWNGRARRQAAIHSHSVSDSYFAQREASVDRNVSRDVDMIMTDESPIYPAAIDSGFADKRRMVPHNKTYGIGTIHTNTIESAFSLLKRGLIGSYHKVSIKHLHRYLSEFSYRFNRRDDQQQLFADTTKNLLNAKTLAYKRLTASQVSDS